MKTKAATTQAQKIKENGLADFLTNNPNISSKDIAEVLGTSPGFISQIKSGRREMPIANALRLEIVYGADAAKLNKEVAEIRKLKAKIMEDNDKGKSL